MQQFELQCKRLSLSDDQKLLHISQYLPSDIANWVARTPKAATWTSLKSALLETFGIPAERYKQVVRKRLESLRQGKLSSRRFALAFETVLLDFPADHQLDATTLKTIYLRAMPTKLRD